MTEQKRKLNVGPLPEEIDLQKHEQTVIRWDRIGLVFGLPLLLVILLAYFAFSADEPTPQVRVSSDEEPQAQAENASETAMVAEPETASELSQASQQAVATQEAVVTPPASEPVVSMTADTGEQDTAAENAPNTPASKTSTAVLPETPPQTSSLPAVSASSSDAPTTVTEAPKPETRQSPARIQISNPAITEAQLISSAQSDANDENLLTPTVMSPEGIIKVSLFTSMQGLQGTTLYHDWFLGEKRMARVRIPVNSKTQRSSSSKFINEQMLGTWVVKVVDQSDALYLKTEFDVVGE